MNYCNFLNLHGSFLPALTGCWAFMCSDIEIRCFYLERQSSCSVSKHARDTGSSRIPECEISPAALLPFPVTYCCFWLVPPLYRSLSAPPLLNPFLQNKDLVLFHSARSWITPWAVRSLPVRFASVSKTKLGSRLPLTWLMGALTSIPWRVGLIHWSDALL